MTNVYPADLAEAGARLFLGWFGHHYARSTVVSGSESDGRIARASVTVGRQWSLSATVLNTFAASADVAWEAGRSAIESRLDTAGLAGGVWVPRGARLPAAEPHLSAFVLAREEAQPITDGRLELRRPVTLHLRRTGTTGSVVTVLGGLAAHWAQFTNRVPGSYQLNATELYRLPASEGERSEVAERIVLAASQPTADESQRIGATDCWTVSPEPDERAVVFGSPRAENDEGSAALRRELRSLLKDAGSAPGAAADARALVVLGGATYAEEEKLSWALRGADPTLYSAFDLLVVIADGVVKPLLQPGRGALPWDAPLP